MYSGSSVINPWENIPFATLLDCLVPTKISFGNSAQGDNDKSEVHSVIRILVGHQQESQQVLVKVSNLLFSKLSQALEACCRSAHASAGLLFPHQTLAPKASEHEEMVISLHPRELELQLLDLRSMAFKMNVSHFKGLFDSLAAVT